MSVARKLSNHEFAQIRVRAERLHIERALADPYSDPDEQALVEMRRLLRSPLESEDI